MFLKRNGKFIAAGILITLVAVGGFIALKVISFATQTTGAERTNVFETPTVNALATTTAQAREAELFGTPGANSRVTSTPGNPATGTASSAKGATTSKLLERIKAGERVSALIMGYGGPGHEGAYLTDTMLVISYDPKTKTVTEFNVPRDLYVFVNSGPGGNGYWGKVNGIFSTIMEWAEANQDKLDARYRWKDKDLNSQHDAAANLATDTIQKVLGFRIDYWVTMNFDGFRKLIDSMGGIDVNVERSFVDNEYPRNDNDQVDASVMTVKFDSGVQHMNGERAIQFARSRKSKGLEEGDPARSRRQMKIIATVKDKALKQNLAFDMLGYLDALQGSIRMTLKLDELYSLANYVNTAEGKSLADSSRFDNEIMNGNNVLDVVETPEYRLIPKDGAGKYASLQQWVQSAFTYSDIRRESVTAQVLNASGIAGVAGKWGDYLFDHGFRMAESEASPVIDKSVLYDYTNGTASANLKQLQKYFPGVKVISQAADQKPYPGAPDFMLYFGKDYKNIIASAAVGQ